MNARGLSVLIAVALAFAAPLGAYATGLAEDAVAEVVSYTRAQLEAARVPGAALAIVHGDALAGLASYGISDPDGAPVTPDTPFLIGSLTKSFTAVALMQLADSGSGRTFPVFQRQLQHCRRRHRGRDGPTVRAIYPGADLCTVADAEELWPTAARPAGAIAPFNDGECMVHAFAAAPSTILISDDTAQSRSIGWRSGSEEQIS